jgi:hypothetical protein
VDARAPYDDLVVLDVTASESWPISILISPATVST